MSALWSGTNPAVEACSPEPAGAVPPATPAWITPDLIRLTLKVWQPRYATPLSAEDAVTILRNTGRLFDALSRE